MGSPKENLEKKIVPLKSMTKLEDLTVLMIYLAQNNKKLFHDKRQA